MTELGLAETKMSSLSRELVFLILQFLDEEKFKESVHKYAQTPLIFVTIWISFHVSVSACLQVNVLIYIFFFFVKNINLI